MQTAESFNAERTGRIEIILDPPPPVLQKIFEEDYHEDAGTNTQRES